MSLATAAAQVINSSPDEKREFDHGELRIRGNTLVIGNSIYPLQNISTISFADLRRPVPGFVWMILGTGLLFLLLGGFWAFLSLPILMIGLHLLYVNWKSKADADFGLMIRMNGGNNAVVMGNNEDFLKRIALELYEVIEFEKVSNATFNIDRSIKVDNISGSVIPIGGVSGDIVNNVNGIGEPWTTAA